jgi:hypothetical protein
MSFYFPAAHADIDWESPCEFLEQELAQVTRDAGIRFPIAKLNDYAEELPRLLQRRNVFALVTAAHLLTQRTRGQNVERYEAKRQLARLLYERNWDRQRIIDLFNIIDWMMHISDDLQSKLLDEIEEIERKLEMPYISSFEQRGLARGRQEGQSKMLASLLTKRFGTLPEPIQARLATASPGELEAWGEALLDAPTLDSVFAKR